MEETKFKFEPIWVSALSLLFAFMIYNSYRQHLFSDEKTVTGIVVIAFIPLMLGVAILPMTFKMLMGIPAILLTGDQLVDNVFGVSIDWSNVQNIRISGARKPFLAIDLKDTDKFYAGIYNPFKRILLKFLFLISPGDVSINLAFVAGNNEAIAATSQVYWNRFYGRND